MRIAIIIVRWLLGLMFLFASISYFVMPPPAMEMQGNIKLFMDGITASGYLMTLVKITELVCGLAFVIGRYVALANIVILPVTVNILMVNAVLMPGGLPMAIALFAANVFLIYAYWNHYNGVISAKKV